MIGFDYIKNNIDDFRKVKGNDNSRFDFPGQKFFKLFFNTNTSNGLFGDNLSTSSALYYLNHNGENKRYDDLLQFRRMLYNICDKTPWYFIEVSGVEELLNRRYISEKEIKIENTPQIFSIKCLPDAYDNRIGILLELYRSIVWSAMKKCEILPANLRKFDMSMIIFNDIVLPNYSADDLRKKSFTYLEFHNCEIDYNSYKSGFSSIKNEEGFNPEFTIDIMVDNVYESQYSEFAGGFNVGDFNKLDILKSHEIDDFKYYEEDDINAFGKKDISYDYITDSFQPSWNKGQASKLDGYKYYNDTGFLYNLVGSVIEAGTNIVYSEVNKLWLGNIFSQSLSDIRKYTQDLLSGNVWTMINDGREIKDIITNSMNISNEDKFSWINGPTYKSLDNSLFRSQDTQGFIKPYTPTSLGNIFLKKQKTAEANTIISNI